MRHWRRVLAATSLAAAVIATPGTAEGGVATCFGEAVTITAQPGLTTNGTSGTDVIVGTPGPDRIFGLGGADKICAGGGSDTVYGGSGSDMINLGTGSDTGFGGTGHDLIRGKSGNDSIFGNRGRDELVGGPGSDTISGGPHADDIRGNSGSDTLSGNKGPDAIHGGKGTDTCYGGTSNDSGHKCEHAASLSERLGDTFGGDGDLIGYTTNTASALPDVGRSNGRYRANLVDNSGNVTLHYHQDQGRLDAKLIEFPFDVTVRNIGIGTQANSQTAPAPNGNPYVFAGVQVHVTNLNDTNSSHVVVGHRGGTHFTIEGKNTRDGNSSVNDIGANTVAAGRADIRIVGNADRTLTVYWQTPNPSPGTQGDNWNLYRGTGTLPGTAPTYGKSVYIGLITYAYGSTGVPFVGTADSIEAN